MKQLYIIPFILLFCCLFIFACKKENKLSDEMAKARYSSSMSDTAEELLTISEKASHITQTIEILDEEPWLVTTAFYKGIEINIEFDAINRSSFHKNIKCNRYNEALELILKLEEIDNTKCNK